MLLMLSSPRSHFVHASRILVVHSHFVLVLCMPTSSGEWDRTGYGANEFSYATYSVCICTVQYMVYYYSVVAWKAEALPWIESHLIRVCLLGCHNIFPCLLASCTIQLYLSFFKCTCVYDKCILCMYIYIYT